MKKNKGFTLIELLAVIVILAILIVIAIPKILNVIDNARASAWNDSVKLVQNAIKLNTSTPNPNTGTYRYTVSSLCNDTSKISEIAKVGDMDITCDNNVFTLTGKNKFNGKEATLTFNSSGNVSESLNAGPTNDSVGSAVYFDPVTTNKCDSTEFSVDAINAGTSTCYKWRIISKSGNNLTVQMDHNLLNQNKWASGTQNTTGPDKALTDLATATSTWTRVSSLNYTYDTTASSSNYGILTCTNGICNTTKNDTTTLIAGATETPVRARLITGEEIKTITINAGATSDSKAGTWTIATSYNNWYYFSNSGYVIGTQTSGIGNTSLAWLVENTSSFSPSGAIRNTYGATNNGYWTLSPLSNYSGGAWGVSTDGDFDYRNVNETSGYGLRPVIAMPKSVFSS